MENNPELQLAWQFIENTGTHLFLTGKAGTGKTTFLRRLKEHTPKRMVILAPTGIAAINAGGVTIHSFFQLSFAPFVPETTFNSSQTHYRYSKEKRNIIRSMDLLVIDEISMVRADLLDAVDATLRRYRDREKPFGGVQLLMIGDLQQLAPVVKDNEWELLRKHYETPYFFASHALKETGVLLMAGILGVCINLSNLYHTYEYSKETMRGKSELVKPDSHNQTKSGLERDYITQWSYGIGETFSLLVPNVKGGASVPLAANEKAMGKANPMYNSIYSQIGQYWGEQPGTSGPVYVGAFVMFLFVLGLFIVKGPMKWALLSATVLSVLLSWGKNFIVSSAR